MGTIVTQMHSTVLSRAVFKEADLAKLVRHALKAPPHADVEFYTSNGCFSEAVCTWEEAVEGKPVTKEVGLP